MSALRLLVIGAHPDDAEFHVGGIMQRFCTAGHVVKVISVTDGSAGHHQLTPNALAEVRRAEAARAAVLFGFSTEVWRWPDGALTACLAARLQVIRAIRLFAPDLVITHRTNDYHPDHRAVGQLVQDASFMVRVPHVADDVPALRQDPVVMFMADFFSRPNAFRADLVVDVGPQMRGIIDMLACHASQVFEWLPWLDGRDNVPTLAEDRRVWLERWFEHRPRKIADRFRAELQATYGLNGARVVHAEALEESEYAARLSNALRQKLFGWMHSADDAR